MSVLGWWVPRSDGNLECQPSKQSPLDPRDKKPGSLGQGSKTYKRGAREKYDPFQRRRRLLWGGPSKPNLMQLFCLPSHALFFPAAGCCCCCGTREAPMRRQVAGSALFHCALHCTVLKQCCGQCTLPPRKSATEWRDVDWWTGEADTEKYSFFF